MPLKPRRPTSPARRIIAATLLLLPQAGPARDGNFLFIDACTSGALGDLTIAQDAAPAANSNSIAGTGGAPFAVTTAMARLAILQSGPANTITGSIAPLGGATGNAFVAVTALSSAAGGSNLLAASVGNGTPAQYALYSQASTATVVKATLNAVAGGVYVQQDTGGGAVDLTVNGGDGAGNFYPLGHLATMPGGTATPTGVPAGFFTTGNPGVAVYQSGATGITAVITPTSPNYTVSISNASNTPVNATVR